MITLISLGVFANKVYKRTAISVSAAELIIR